MRTSRSSKSSWKSSWPPLVDPSAEVTARDLLCEYGGHAFVQWGDDARYQLCLHCGFVRAVNISHEARYGRGKPLPERPVKHRHYYERCTWDDRYERCYCGALRNASRSTGQPSRAIMREPEKPFSAPLTHVVHCRKDAFDHYIGRPMARFPELRPMGFGNPFTVRNLPHGYDNAVDAFRDWLLGKAELAEVYREQRAVMLTQLPLLRGNVLGCWCAPKGGLPGNLYGEVCHGEVLAWLADHPQHVQTVRVEQMVQADGGVS